MAEAQVDPKQFPHGICPFMSHVQVVEGDPGGKIVPVHGQGLRCLPILAPCQGEGCQLWQKRHFGGERIGDSSLKTDEREVGGCTLSWLSVPPNFNLEGAR